MIPKIIHYCWFGGNDIPEKDKKCIESWKKYCPDYKIIQWNESNYDITKNQYMKECYESKRWGFVGDYARLDIIYNYGGFYFDTDVELIKPIDELLNLKGFAGFEVGSNDKKYVALGLGFGAEAQNEIIGKMRDEYKNAQFVRNDGSLNLLPSPHYSTKVLENYGLICDGNMQDINGFRIFPEEYFCPLSPLDNILRKTNNTYSIHLYSASWMTEDDRIRFKYVNNAKAKYGNKIGYYLGTLRFYLGNSKRRAQLWKKLLKK